MKRQYKLIIYEKNLYKEIELSSETKKVIIGTAHSAECRLQKNLIFMQSESELELELSNTEEGWKLEIKRPLGLLFLSSESANNKNVLTLEHYTEFQLKQRNSNLNNGKTDAVLLRGRLCVDFDYENKRYDCFADISGIEKVIIGGKNAHIPLSGDCITQEEYIEIKREKNQLYLKANPGKYGVFVNGRQLEAECVRLNNYDFFSIAYYSFYYKDGKLYMDSRLFDGNEDVLKSSVLQFNMLKESLSTMEYPRFQRNVRMKNSFDKEDITLLSPREKPQEPQSNLLMRAVPTIMMLVLMVLVRGVMSSASGWYYLIYSAGSMLIGLGVSVVSMKIEKKKYQKNIADRITNYRNYINEKREEIKKIRENEAKLLNSIYLPYTITKSYVEDFSGHLFNRIPEDEDFIDVRIGSGSVEGIRKIVYNQQQRYEADDDELVNLPVKLADEFKEIQNAPIVLSLKNANVAGIIGNNGCLYEMFKIILFDLCVRQYYHDVKVFLFLPEMKHGRKEYQKYSWTKWLRNLQNPVIGRRNIICDEESRKVILDYLYAELDSRERSGKNIQSPHITVLVMEDYGIMQHPVSKYIQNASDFGCTFIFFEENRDSIPIGCSQLVTLKNQDNSEIDKKGEGILQHSDSEQIITHFEYEFIPDEEISILTHKLAPVFCDEISLESSLTKHLTLFEMLRIFEPEDLDLAYEWSNSDITNSLAAPIGVSRGNKEVLLDISDGKEKHGPHGLIAGTTGSGKSEILMTYILSMAVKYSPMDVAFVIIDFKAGGMGDHFRNLPHTLGVITDIDGDQIQRSLISIKAEIERRKWIFKEINSVRHKVYGEKCENIDHIDEYITAYKSEKEEKVEYQPLPHLIIIVDEFAELKAAHPEFMAELIHAARVGRSLGVHLILATQKPHGQVDPQIDSNSNFRLCLKVQSPSDSMEVIKSPLAAEIREPGRAYFLVGNNERFELFQSAYSGAGFDRNVDSTEQEFQIAKVDFAGRRSVAYKHTISHFKETSAEERTSQKTALLSHIQKVFQKECEAGKMHKLPDICKPPLKDKVEFPEIKKAETNKFVADVGIYDSPAQQTQETYSLEVSAGNTFVVGSMQTGKTSFLQLLIRSMTEKYSPYDVHFYIIDYASGILAQLGAAVNVGGVVIQNETDKLHNLLKLLKNEIESRKQYFTSLGCTSYENYRLTAQRKGESNKKPFILLLIDNFMALRELHFLKIENEEEKMMMNILREGLSVGISVVATNTTTRGLEHRYLNAFQKRIGFYNSSNDEYSTLFGMPRLSLKQISGRCLIVHNQEIHQCQTFIPFEGETAEQRNEAIAKWCIQLRDTYNLEKRKTAVKIPEVPELVTEEMLYENYKSCFAPYKIAIGFDYDTICPVTLDLLGMNLIVSGTQPEAQTNFAEYLISCLQRQAEKAPVEIAVFDKSNSMKLRHIAEQCSCVKTYSTKCSDMKKVCAEWKKELEVRKQLLEDGSIDALNNKPLLLMVCEDSGERMLEGFDTSLFAYLPYKFAWIASNAVNYSFTTTSKLYYAKKNGADCISFGSFKAGNVLYQFTGGTSRNSRYEADMPEHSAWYVKGYDSTRAYRVKMAIHPKQNDFTDNNGM